MKKWVLILTKYHSYSGQFIVVEGPDASGKTTTINDLKEILPKDKVVYTREPGGTVMAERIRDILLNNDSDEELLLDTQMYLFAASRKQHMQNVIIPALKTGKIVICDRFILSTLAYQSGIKSNQSLEEQMKRIAKVLDVNKPALWDDENEEYVLPDKTFFFNVSVDTMTKRLSERGMEDDKDRQLDDISSKIELLASYKLAMELLQNNNLEDIVSVDRHFVDNDTVVERKLSYQGWYDFAHNLYSIDANRDRTSRAKAMTHLIGLI